MSNEFGTSGLSLKDIIFDLEKQAADSDEEKKDEKEEGKDKDKTSKSDGKKDDKEDAGKKDDKDSKGEQEKEASVTTGRTTLAQELMQKVASITINSEDSMNKTQAQEAGQLLASQLLEKLASAGDQNTTNGVAAGAVPNKAIVDSAAIVAEDDAKIQALPGAGGSINQIYDAVIADALAQGAASQDQVHTQGVARVEGVPEQAATPGQVDTVAASDEQEKAAAVSALVADGVDFDEAINLVKAAAEDLANEGQVKAAAISDLVASGVSFNEAVSMVKSAGVAQAKPANIEQEKRAAFDMLVSGGVDLFTAAELVNSKSAQIYGE